MMVNDLRSLGEKAHAIVVSVAQGTYAKASDRQRSKAIYVLGRTRMPQLVERAESAITAVRRRRPRA
jgi:hypothetical protein